MFFRARIDGLARYLRKSYMLDYASILGVSSAHAFFACAPCLLYFLLVFVLLCVWFTCCFRFQEWLIACPYFPTTPTYDPIFDPPTLSFDCSHSHHAPRMHQKQQQCFSRLEPQVQFRARWRFSFVTCNTTETFCQRCRWQYATTSSSSLKQINPKRMITFATSRFLLLLFF